MNERTPSVNGQGNASKALFLTMSLILLLVLAVSGPTTETVTANVQPVLINLAAEEPDSLVEVIVQKTGDGDTATTLAENLGATVTKDLHILNAFAAQIPASAVLELAQSPEVYWISYDAPVMKTADSGDPYIVTLREDFNTTTYDGGLSGNWAEIGEEDGPEVGDVVITNFLGGALQGLRIQKPQKGIQGAFDLTLAESAAMSISFRRKGFTSESDFVAVEISSDGGTTWTEIDRLAGPSTDPNVIFGNYDLTPFVANHNLIRFISSPSLQATGKFYIDYIQIDYRINLADIAESTITAFQNDDSATLLGTMDSFLSILPNEESDTYRESVTTISETVRDEFNTVSYANNDGTTDWTAPWIENDPYGGQGTAGGYVYVNDGRLYIHYAYVSEENIIRSVDLSGATEATLSFDWITLRLDANETVSVLISPNGQEPFTELAAYGYTQTGSAQFDISAYISENTTIRFENRSTNWEYNEGATFDNVQISYSCGDCIDTSNLANSYVQAIKADQLWNGTPYLQGQNITVAILDSGISLHEDLQDDMGVSRVIAQVQFMTNDATSPDDLYGHGTHIAGTIGGNGVKSNGAYIGVAPKANLVDVKVIDDHGAGYTSDVVAGIQWIYENKDTYNIRVVNVSLNSAVAESYYDSPLDAALEILWFNGITVVVSVGNNGSSEDGYLYAPSNDPFFIAVGATDTMGTSDINDDQLATYSAHGITPDGYLKPDLLSPGSDIISLLASDDCNLVLEHPDHALEGPDGNYYFRMSGTSMSSAVASGAAALLLQAEPDLSPDQVKYRLMTTGTDFGTPLPGPESVAYLDVLAAINTPTTTAANQDIVPNMLLAKMALIAYWASQNGDDNIDWGNIDWESVNWDTVDWDTVDWSSVNWGSVNWGSVNWGSVNWGSVNWGSVNWGSVNWGSVNWGSVNWGSVNWGSVDWD